VTERVDPTAVARDPPATAATDAPLAAELRALGVPAPVAPATVAAEFGVDDGCAWAPGRDVRTTVEVAPGAVSAPDPSVPDGVAELGGVEPGPLRDEPGPVSVEVSVEHDRGAYRPRVVLDLDGAETTGGAVVAFWTAVHWARAAGVPGVSKEGFACYPRTYRLGGLYQYAGFARVPRERNYHDHGERYVEDDTALAQFRPAGLAPVADLAGVEPSPAEETVDRSGDRRSDDGPGHASAILSAIDEDEG
jgi:hypothetical protein